MKNKFLLNNVMARLAGSAAIGLLAFGVFVSSQALAGIASTKHNLTSTGTGTNKFTPGGGAAAEICVFCHTPHGADATAAVPLWNKTLTAPTYPTYNSLGTSSLDGATAPVGSVSIACLSCHDGAQAMNTMINAPGSGLANAAWTIGGGGVWAGVLDGKMTGIAMLNDTVSTVNNGLKNDHPIGIQYGGGPANAAAVTNMSTGSVYAFLDPDFNDTKSASLNGTRVWWVDSGTTTGSRDKADMQLYTRTETGFKDSTGTNSFAAATVAQPYVECGSCHDPHVQDVAGSNPTFLRMKNDGSKVCLACHDK